MNIKHTDYSKKENWFLNEYYADADYDVIFLYATSADESIKDNGIVDIDVQKKRDIKQSFDMCGSMFTTEFSYDKNCKKNNYKSNVFIPYYRQVSSEYLMKNCNDHEFLINYIKKNEPFIDLFDAFDYYFENYNKDGHRPFVLAGHSQGAACLQVLLEEYFIKTGHQKYLKNMIAMYLIGYGVSKIWFDGLDKKFDGNDIIHIAKNESDTNCVISWNLEGPDGGDGNVLLPKKNDAYIINPINWKIDETMAYKKDNEGVLLLSINSETFELEYIFSDKEEHKYDAKINLERGSIVTSERSKREYMSSPLYENIFGGKSLHLYDCSAFYANIGRNFFDRLNNIFSLNSEKEVDENYFISELSGIDDSQTIPLPDIYGDKEENIFNFRKDIVIDKNLINELCNKLKITEDRIFTATYVFTLGKYVGSENLLFSIILNASNDEKNILPFYQDYSNVVDVSDFISNINSQINKLEKYPSFSYSKIIEKLKLNIESCFSYHNEKQIKDIENDIQKFKLYCCVKSEKEKYVFECKYFSNFFSNEFIEEFYETYSKIVSEILLKEKLSEIEVCSEKQIKELDLFNSSKCQEYNPDTTIISLFRESAKKYPDTVALVFKEKKYTYKELDEITDIIASHIDKIIEKKNEQGVVSILIPRNEYMAILPLAVQKAGCCYEPLDPSYPKERLNFMVKDAGASLLIADPSLKDVLTDYSGKIILTNEIENMIKEGIKSPLPIPAKSDDIFVLLYTSGSTGTPKGVILEQRNLVAFCLWYREYYGYKVGDNLACYASFGFDAHMFETYGSFASGFTCHIIPEEMRLDLIALNNYFKENNIVGTFLTTAVGVQFATSIEDTSLKTLITGGEKMVSLEPPKNYQLFNIYGPTETTLHVTIKSVDKKEENIPIGKPINTIYCYIVDKYMHRLPIGAAGELIIAGPQVGRGYLNLPDKTEKSFIKNPFTSGKSEYHNRAYRTGDIVRWRVNGDIEFVGRKDGQVKIHGFRIELKEIEAVIREFDDIKDVTVQAIDGDNGEKYIVAYIVSEGKVKDIELKKFIANKKPQYMVPSVVVELERIPLNINQKVDKKALPIPKKSTSDYNIDKVVSDVPLNILEKELKPLVAEVLGTEDFAITSRLLHFGLTSISAIKLATLLYKKYGVSIKGTELISYGTLQEIENAILKEWMKDKNESEKDVIDKNANNIKDNNQNNELISCPLSFTQLGVYADCLVSPDMTLYNTPFCISFPQNINIDELKKAICEVVKAHPTFSIQFANNEKNEIIQYFKDNYTPEIIVKEMSEDEIKKYCKSFINPFKLVGEPLARFEIIKANSLYLLMDLHHLITDGTSVDIFIRQLCDCLEGKEPEKEEYTYIDYVRDEKIKPETEKFFENRMSEYDCATELIPDIFEEGLKHTEGVVSIYTDLKEVSDFASKNNLTTSSIYLAAELIAGARYTFEDNVAIATISNGRNNMKIFNTLGMFVNTLPLMMKIDNNEDTVSFIKKVAKNYIETIENENYPFAQIAKKFDFHPSLSYTYQVGVIDKYYVNGVEISVEELSVEKAKLPCAVYIMGSVENGGSIQVNYDKAMYSKNMILGFAKSINNIVKELMCKKTLNDISLTNEDDWKILDSYNSSFDLNYDNLDTAVSLFKKQVIAHPDKIAAIYKDKKYTYNELDEITDRFAEIIYDEMSKITGYKELLEQVIPIITSRNENTFIFPLAVLKTGCAYEPLDPDYPSERLNFMVKDSGAKVLIAERGLKKSVSEFDGKVIFIDELYKRLENKLCFNVSINDIPKAKPENLFILLYTSGTTGTPKGVQLEHRNLIAYAYGSSEACFYTEDSKTASYASFGFDVNMADTFCTLLNGGTVYVIEKDMRMNLDSLSKYFDEVGITTVLLTTQVGVQFTKNYPKMKTLKTITIGGEKLPSLNIEELSYQVNNGYGPTENCCGVSLFPIVQWEPNIPIGKPMKTINAFILDKTEHRLPAGAIGQYCLSGPQVARGYLNRPDKTKEAFCKCPFNEYRMYHTGDIVRYRENGDVEFVGRKDGQVKIRGFRVELKEIEAVIRTFNGIDDVTVQAFDFEGGGKYLAAYVIGKNKIDSNELSDYIKSKKPAYMVPSAIVQIEQIPLTINRKVDKKALPIAKLQKTEYVAPKTKEEKDFCQIFKEILEIEKAGVEDDFFEMGGSSISAMKVVIAAGKLGYNIVYQDVFDNYTPRMLSEYVMKSQHKEIDEKDEPNVILSKDIKESFYGEGITEIGRDGYDYSKINELLRKNTIDAFLGGKKIILNDVLLTGATGFLGIHMLYDLINNGENKIYCIVRNKDGVSGEERLKKLLIYYFSNDYNNLFGNRIFVIEGDIKDSDSLKKLKSNDKITVINCAANVSHFAKGDNLERDNVDSVNNLIDWCIEYGVNLVHISTRSVFENYKVGMHLDNIKFTEHMLYVGQTIEENKYIYSKFMAERSVYEAILNRGLKAKVIRMGNLAPRYSDGLFQKNYKTNNFMNTILAYKSLGKISYDMMSDYAEFTPIDCAARAVILLATTPMECTCFILTNPNKCFFGNVVMNLSTKEAPIKMIESEEMKMLINDALKDSKMSEIVSSLVVYNSSNDKEKMVKLEQIDVSHTVQVLYRLGFSWPITDDDYVKRFIEKLNKNDFFK